MHAMLEIVLWWGVALSWSVILFPLVVFTLLFVNW